MADDEAVPQISSATLSSGGRIVIPSRLLGELDWMEGEKLQLVLGDGLLVIQPMRMMLAQAQALLKQSAEDAE